LNARPVVYIVYRKPLGDNIYKQWDLWGVMVIRLDIETWVIGIGGTKRAGGKGVGGGSGMGAAGFCGH
jgi:hypothetical protein